GLENLNPQGAADDFDDRAGVLDKLEQSFARTSQAGAATAHATTYRRALELMRSDKAKAFDLALEPEASRKPYGESLFGKGCLLARRLVEAGVSFVEVYLGDWDTTTRPVAAAPRGARPQAVDGWRHRAPAVRDAGR